MSTKIVQMQDENENNEFPVTSTKAVYDDENNRLDNTLSSINDSLNSIKTKQESYKMGALINIKTYTTDNYTCPNDGYAYVINNSGNTGHILIGNSVSVGGSEGKFSTYVKKGMTLKVYGTVASAYFCPITNT